MITGFLISVLGGSKTQIGGPTGAFVVVVAGIVATHGVDGLFMCTMMAGVLLVILGVTGMGSAVKFIPRPVVIGFTNGIPASTPPQSRMDCSMEARQAQQNKRSGGESGIRTHVRVSPKHAFQACAFSHSAISPVLLGSYAPNRGARQLRKCKLRPFDSMAVSV